MENWMMKKSLKAFFRGQGSSLNPKANAGGFWFQHGVNSLAEGFTDIF
jgi:hypothetical protein